MKLPLNTTAELEAIKTYLAGTVANTAVTPAVAANPPAYNLKTKAGVDALIDAIDALTTISILPVTGVYDIKNNVTDMTNWEAAVENGTMQDVIRIENPFPAGSERSEVSGFVVYGAGTDYAGVLIITCPINKSYYALLITNSGGASGLDFRQTGIINWDHGRIALEIVHT